MRKSTREMLIVLIVVALIGGLIVFFGWATDWFTSWNRFKSWFGSAGQKVHETFSDNDEAVTKSAANAGLIHDSDDVTITVNVEQCNKPNNHRFIDDDTLGIQYYHVSRTAIIGSCDVYAELVEPQLGGYSNYTNKVTLYEALEFPDIDISGYIDTGYIKINRNDVYDAFGGLLDTHYPIVRFTCIAKKTGYLDSEPYSFTLYVGKDIPQIEWVSDTGILITSVGAPTPENTVFDQEICDSFFCSFDIQVGSPIYTGDPYNRFTITDSDYLHSSEIPACFSSRKNDDGSTSFLCDLTKFSKADTIGEYMYSFNSLNIGCVRSGSSTSGATNYFDNLKVWCKWVQIPFTISKLSAPGNVHIEDTSLKWEAVDGAQGYTVFDDRDCNYTVTETFFELEGRDYNIGEHTFRIRALGNVGAALASENVMLMTAYNASSNITPCVVLTYDIEGDTVTKFVPRGKALENYLYDVEVDGKVFGGWYYDSGYSLAVETGDTLDKDTTIYARLSDLPVEPEAPVKTSWWDRNMWYVLGPIFAGLGLAVIAVTVKVIRDKKKGR